MKNIIRMARQAHHELVTQDYPGHAGQLDHWTMHLLERFAALVRADEREACARSVGVFDKTFNTGGCIAYAVRTRK